MNIFPNRLKELRKEKNLTQLQLAEDIKTTDDSIYSWEKGRSEPSIEMIHTLCKYFNVTSDYLLGIEDETGSKNIKYYFNNNNFDNNNFN